MAERLSMEPTYVRLLVFELLTQIHPQRLPGLLELYSAIGHAVQSRRLDGLTAREAGLIEHLDAAVAEADFLAAERSLRSLAADGIDFVTVLDEAYPVNLRSIKTPPPALFVQGELAPEDALAVAVVGTRRASDRGVTLARQMARRLAERGVTVVSGLAAGIDTAAHEATLAAGGRTIAVMGTGHDKIYPAANRDLAARIRRSGALVSQFPPGARVLPFNFANRNWVTSGISLGTVVIEADATSGAKVQAHDAVKQGRFVFLIHSLVTDQPWAQRMVERGHAIEVDSVDDVMTALEHRRPPQGPAARSAEEQLTLPV